jgi:ribosomal protein S18 acetylase RimI-like enzyme
MGPTRSIGNFHIRQFDPETDLPRLVELLGEVEEASQDGEDTSEKTQRMYMSLPNHNPAQDRWVIEVDALPGKLVGYASTWARNVWSPVVDRAESYIAVHPGYRRSGLGGLLLKKILRRARQLETTHVVIHANEHNLASNTFLKKHGFTPVGDNWLLRTSGLLDLEQPLWPAGYTVSTYAQVRDPLALLKARESFRDMWGHYGPRPGDEQQPAWLERINHEGIFLVFGPGYEVAGYCLALERGLEQQESIPEGYIDEPGILPEHRNKGLVRPLVLTALGWLQARGCKANTLDSWGEDEQTIAIYRSLGFVVVRHMVSYLLNLGPEEDEMA